MDSKKSKSGKIDEHLITFMKSRNLWDDNLLNELPRCYEKFGFHLLFPESAFSNKHWREAGEDLWKLVCTLFGGKFIAIRGSIQKDAYRTPKVRLLYGEETVVNFIDNHIKYTWDIEKNMFCSGNVNERHRVARLNCEGEVIVDLFAGIGYFTLPYLVHSKAKFVHACEWNRNAIEALKRNLELNAVSERCQIYFGDNRKVSPRRVANRVNLGLIPSSEEYWTVGCEALLEKGGILYVHQNVTSKFSTGISCTNCDCLVKNLSNCDITKYFNRKFLSFECYFKNKELKWEILDERSIDCKHYEWFLFAVHISHSLAGILKNLYSEIWKVNVSEIFKVKSYAPHIDHLVFTVNCYPTL